MTKRSTSSSRPLEDISGLGRPDEGFGMFVLAIDVTADCQEQFFEIAKYTAPQSVLSEIAEESLHHVEPRCTGRSEVHVEPWMACEPALNFGMLVRRVVVPDQV